MRRLTDLQLLIQDAVSRLNYPAYPADLYEPITYILSLGGKRMRPALLLMACDLFGGDVDGAVMPALAIEVFHNFTLMHDDIMDKAPLRRGKVTVHEKWNQNIAILSGDAMMVEANRLMMMVDNSILRPVLDVFNNTATGVCEGQQIDMSFEQQNNVTASEYINMIRLKTAVLLGGAMKIGALIGGSPVEDAERIYAFGVQLGIAFQLQDDILDVYGDPDKFGKQVGGDIISNKKTYLLIKALELADENQTHQLNHWINAINFNHEDKVNAITAIYDNLEVRQYATLEMQNYTDRAFEALDALNIPDLRKQYLRDFADGLMVREN